MFSADQGVVAGGDPDWSKVSILLHFDGTNGSTTITDSSSNNRTFTASGATLSTSQKKFGTASLAVGTNNDAYTTASLGVNTQNFTLEGWVYFASFSDWVGSPFTIGTSSWLSANSMCPLFGSTVVRMSIGSSYYDFTHGMSANTWYHFCIQRSGNSWYMYRDGTQIGSTVTNSTSLSASNFYVNGTSDQGDMPNSSYVDEVRLTVGTTRYNLSGFTAPTAAFPNG